MNDGALDHALETSGWLHIEVVAVADNRGKLGFDIVGQAQTQFLYINFAGRKNFKRIAVFR